MITSDVKGTIKLNTKFVISSPGEPPNYFSPPLVSKAEFAASLATLKSHSPPPPPPPPLPHHSPQSPLQHPIFYRSIAFSVYFISLPPPTEISFFLLFFYLSYSLVLFPLSRTLLSPLSSSLLLLIPPIFFSPPLVHSFPLSSLLIPAFNILLFLSPSYPSLRDHEFYDRCTCRPTCASPTGIPTPFFSDLAKLFWSLLIYLVNNVYSSM